MISVAWPMAHDSISGGTITIGQAGRGDSFLD